MASGQSIGVSAPSARPTRAAIWPKNLLVDSGRFLEERFGFGVLAHILVQQEPEVIQGIGSLLVLRTMEFGHFLVRVPSARRANRKQPRASALKTTGTRKSP